MQCHEGGSFGTIKALRLKTTLMAVKQVEVDRREGGKPNVLYPVRTAPIDMHYAWTI